MTGSLPAAERVAILLGAQRHARKMIEQREPLSAVLAHLCHVGESLSGPRSVCSILVVDAENRLRNGASPRLPPDYLAAIDGLRPHPDVGTCAAAAATGEVVVTPDFRADRRWAELKHLPLALGFLGAWSQPIKSDTRRVLGTFGTYFRERREPTPPERGAVCLLAATAAFAIERTQVATT